MEFGTWRAGSMYSGPALDRRCSVTRLSESACTTLNASVEALLRIVNQNFQFQIDAIERPFQVMRYETGQYIRSHIDSTPGESTRKITFSIQLTDDSQYAGGDLRFQGFRRQPAFMRLRGALTAFPSYMNHEITPVESGVRHSLVFWAVGPHFR